MRRNALSILVLTVVVAGCATVPSRTPLLTTAAPTAVVLATAIIAPEALQAVVADAVLASPELAVQVAAAAAAAAPDQAMATLATVMRNSPLWEFQSRDIIAATKVKRRGPVVARVEVPKPERLAALIEDAVRQ